MTLKDLLKKKEKVEAESSSAQQLAAPPAFTFIRTTTNTQEIIDPPTYPGDQPPASPPQRSLSHRLGRFRRHSNASQLENQNEKLEVRPKGERRLSERLHLGSRDRAASTSSVNIPADLPEIQGEEGEDVWEKRATLLAKSNPNTPEEGKKSSDASVVDKVGDVSIQTAIDLHEAGDFTKASEMFGQLADPHGANNALSQVLYGLALRHGWGIPKDETRAVTYLSYAASNSADVEALALQAGMKKGGAAKGELTLAIFELANCFRNGWGVQKDPVAAKQYYETAANMGDTDAMNEAAWCYLEGFGCKKDKFRAAQLLRLAEEKGVKTLGNTWIYKDKYGGPMKSKFRGYFRLGNVVDRALRTWLLLGLRLGHSDWGFMAAMALLTKKDASYQWAWRLFVGMNGREFDDELIMDDELIKKFQCDE
ncbi:hypothetical protein FKW77_008342 [Venturia effusa]|uniref:Uncharacterized protein n=1 Tax=Venturia effusa TaxID=50376 RepID=A0A517LBD8_9PEZI|nr:hypothetical protein FKW77_008342 [Venturia effusa]